jgi:hypothetical protein
MLDEQKSKSSNNPLQENRLDDHLQVLMFLLIVMVASGWGRQFL